MADKNGYIGRAPSDSSVTIARQVNTLSGIQTTFTFTSGYDVGYLDVFVNGTKLVNAVDFQATDTQNVTLTLPGQSGDVIEFVAYKAFNLAKTIVQSDGDLEVLGTLSATVDVTATGAVTAGTDITAGGSITATGDITSSGSISGDGSPLSGIVTTITAGDNISVNSSTGTVTITGLANTANVVSDSLVVTGVTTLGTVQGISGISTTFVSAVGIQSGGTTIGTGITQLNFVGTGNTFKVTGTTVDISIEGGGGGGGLSTTGVSTGYIFSNPNQITTSISLTQPGYNYGLFGPITIGSGVTITVGAGNSFTVV